MIKKLKNQAGMSLMEVMVALLIMVLLVVGMGTGMDAGMRVYSDATFEANGATLAGYLNTALTDVLRYTQDIKSPAASGDPCTFTNLELGLRNAYIKPNENGILYIYSTDNGFTPKALVNTGAYTGLKIKDSSFKLTYADDTRGGYFLAEFIIASADGKEREPTQVVVRIMNG